jgi:protoporphyrinogen/coproporphyrinogen III oxidase
MSTRVAVVGGGPAGLAAAVTLAASGHGVTVYEASAQAGGLLRTDELEGARVDVGVQLVSSTHSALLDLLRRADAGGLLRAAPGRDALWRKERAHGITYGSVSSMIASGALPMSLKLKLGARYLPFLTTQLGALDANDPAGTGGVSFDGESIGAWGRRELGDDFVELLAYPLLAAYYGATPEETSAAIYHALARVGMDVKVLAAAGGFGAVAAALLRALSARGGTVLTGRRVSRVEYGDGDVAIDGDVFDAAILAVPASAAVALLQGADPGVVAWLNGVEERRTFTVAYRLDRRFPGDYFGLSFPRNSDTGRRVAVVCIGSRKLAELVPDGDTVLLIPAPGAAQQLFDSGDDAVAEALLSSVERAVPGIGQRVTATRVYRWESGYSVFGPGHLQRLRDMGSLQLPARIALAGDYLVAPSVEGAVRSGLRAAARVAGMLQG